MLTFGTFTELLISTALILENGSWSYGYDSDMYLNIICCKGEYLIVDKELRALITIFWKNYDVTYSSLHYYVSLHLAAYFFVKILRKL